MNSRLFKHRISIKNKKNVSDGAGGYNDKPDYETIAETWASINTLSGREFWQAQQMQAEVSNKVIIRYRTGIKRSQVVFYNKRELDIQYIFNRDENNKFLELYCLEKV